MKRQNDIRDCGLNIIQAFHHHFFHYWIDINFLKQKANFGNSGISLSNLINLGHELNLNVDVLEGDFAALQKLPSKKFATIVKNDGQNHYVIFELRRKSVLIIDPLKGRRFISFEEFKNIFSKILIVVSPKKKSKIDFRVKAPFHFLTQNPLLLSWVFIALIIEIVATFSLSVFVKLVLDKVMPGALESLLTFLTITFGWLAILKVLNGASKSYFIQKFAIIIENDLTKSYLQKLQLGSLGDLNKLTQSDHLRRISLLKSVSSFLANGVFVVVNEALRLLVAFSILLWLSTTLFAISLTSGALVVLLAVLIHILVKDKYSLAIAKELEWFQSNVNFVSSVSEQKEPNFAYFSKRESDTKYLLAKKTQFQIWKFLNWQGILQSLLTTLGPIALLFFASHQVFNGSLTIGTSLMILTLHSQFIDPVASLSNFFLKLKQNRKHFSLLKFVLSLDNEKNNPQGVVVSKIESIYLKMVSIGYDKELFKITDYKITTNLHITGQNGSGKSTLLKTLATRHSAKGKISINDLDLSMHSVDHLRSRIFFTFPTTYLPNCSIFEAITLRNEVGIKRFRANVEKYALSQLMSDLGINFEQKIVNNGQNLSSGQRQLVLIFRLFAFEYDLILIDEGLENVDKQKVVQLSKYLHEVQKAIYIEVSHSKKYLSPGKEVSIEKIASN